MVKNRQKHNIFGLSSMGLFLVRCLIFYVRFISYGFCLQFLEFNNVGALCFVRGRIILLV